MSALAQAYVLPQTAPPFPRGVPTWRDRQGSWPTLDDSLLNEPYLGARRLLLVGIQLLTELRLAQSSKVALVAVTPDSVRVARPGTPFEQATLERRVDRAWRPEQEIEGLRDVGRLLLTMLDKRLYLEDSLPDERGRFGGVPLPRRVDMPVLLGVHRGVSRIARRCESWSADASGDTALPMEDLSRLSLLLNRIIAGRRPRLPQWAVTYPPRPQALREATEKVLVHAPRFGTECAAGTEK